MRSKLTRQHVILPESLVEEVRQLVAAGHFSSISDVVRHALRNLERPSTEVATTTQEPATESEPPAKTPQQIAVEQQAELERQYLEARLAEKYPILAQFAEADPTLWDRLLEYDRAVEDAS